MNHLAAIWEAYQQARSRGETCILATIVQTQGSTYRKPGARMLILPSGEAIGMLSGGCLEADILAHCEQVQQTGEPRIVVYDTSTEEDIRWGFGLGCDGAVKVLLEVLPPDRLNPLAALISPDNQAIATVFATDSVEIPIGAKLLLSQDQAVTTDINNANFANAIVADLRLADQRLANLRQSRTQTKTYTIGQQEIQVLLETIQPIPQLILFGAGRDALPVVDLAKTLGWRVTMVDCRGQAASRERFSQADTVILTRREIVAEQVSVLSTASVVVMTHNYYDDLAILESVLPIQPKYIGILGSRGRSQKLITELSPAAQHLAAQLHQPIGLDLGGEAPEEIALAIIAEIQAVQHDRQGIFLKHRAAPIHVAAPQHV